MAEFLSLSSEVEAITVFDDYTAFERKRLLQKLQSALSESEENQTALGTQPILDFITKNLEDGDLAIVECGLAAWIAFNRREILSKPTMSRVNCEKSEAKILKITDVIRHKLQSSRIAYLCCALVMILASDSPDRQAKLGLVGFGVHMCTILKSPYGNDPEVTEMAYRAIRNLSIDDNNCAQIVNKGDICEVLIPQLAAAEEQTLSHAVLEALLYAVVNLSNDAEVCQFLGEEGVVTALIRLFPVVISYNALCNVLCAALRNLFAVNENLTFTESFPDLGHQLLEVHRRHRDDPDTMQAAIWCLANLASDVTFRRTFAVRNGAEIMTELHSTFNHGLHGAYPDDIDLGPVAEAIVFAIYSLVYDGPEEDTKDNSSSDTAAATTTSSSADKDSRRLVATQIALNGGLDLLQVCLQRYRSREAMVEACFRSLIALVQNHKDVRTALSKRSPKYSMASLAILPAILEHVQVVQTVFLGLVTMLALLAGGDNQDFRIECRDEVCILLLKKVATALFSTPLRRSDQLMTLLYAVLMSILPADDIDKQMRTEQFVAAGLVTVETDSDAVTVKNLEAHLDLVCAVFELDSSAILPLEEDDEVSAHEDETDPAMEKAFEDIIRRQLAQQEAAEVAGTTSETGTATDDAL